MDAEKFTKKSLEVIESCEKLAYEYNNQELTQAHLMYALVTVEDSLIAKLLTNMGINMDAFTGECEKLVQTGRRYRADSCLQVRNFPRH